MRILILTRSILDTIAWCSMPECALTRFGIYQWSVFATNMTLLMIMGVASVLFMWHYIQIGAVAGTLCGGFRVVGAFGSSISVAIHKGKIRVIIDGSQMIRDPSKYFGIHARLYYDRTEDISGNFIKWSSISVNGVDCVMCLLFAAVGGFSQYIQNSQCQPSKLCLSFKIL